MDEPDQTLKSSILLAAAKKLKNKDLPAQRQSCSQQAQAVDLDPADDHSLDGSIDCSDYITNEYNTFSVDQYGQPYSSPCQHVIPGRKLWYKEAYLYS